ncbi:hypothetical protein LTR47_003007 [Exophiala xenobiotica]|nr:hypothetical protein LTR47_003007 [Exophiala xenobiotica]KAK5255273.1 hypothetical protein LTS06_000686 [Exophiala xenobiotica]KAK5351406.1 hypothetical protein LTR61_004756 [Exophiala xenobiotica]KAK5383661.1 hypothetical protein LTR11_002670 [Exophiala xenobiotica]KAK5384946.1 hypothetical protein LTS03_002910 [Exophiala xenobiotica]
MDTSSERYSVAALLSGRLGMLWDLHGTPPQTRYRSNSGEPMNLGMQTTIHDSATDFYARPLVANLPIRSQELLAAQANYYDSSPPSMLRQDFPADNDAVEDDESELVRLSMPVETRATAIYANLGSPDDLPRSVAICPNRKCVAFGCRMGIELHWVDAMTGGDLNRWFPLAAPSDYLYFLPQRPGLDSRKKLRLISSAAGPIATQLFRSDSTPARWKYWPTSAAHGRRQSLTRLFFGNLPFPTAAIPQSARPDLEARVQGDEVQGILRAVDCDHFRAVPVSDGSHMLFTDPANGMLCLGSDAPLGGPTKLVRKIVFTPPPHPDGRYCSSLRYTAGKPSDWGLRVVAAYNDGQIVLYNVPSDIFRRIQDIHSSTDVWDENAGVVGQSDLLMDAFMSSHTDQSTEPRNGTAAAPSPRFSPERPLHIDGVVIACAENDFVDDLSVQTEGGGCSVWIFYRSGRAELRSIYWPRNHRKGLRYIGEDGLVYDVDGGSLATDDDS